MNRLMATLVRAAEPMPDARVPEDIWRRGRRRHRRRLAVTATASMLALVALVTVPIGLSGHGRGNGLTVGDGGDGAVPAEVHLPWPWQQPVVEAPAGPAALLVSGVSGLPGWGMGSSDWFT